MRPRSFYFLAPPKKKKKTYTFFSAILSFGPTNTRLRMHLALTVPPEGQDAPELRVGGVARSWKEGRVLVFDDSFEHHVSPNDSTVDRVVLIVDLWHPQLSPEERAALGDIWSI